MHALVWQVKSAMGVEHAHAIYTQTVFFVYLVGCVLQLSLQLL